MKQLLQTVLFFILLFSVSSCKKLIDAGEPKTQLTTDKAFADEQSALAVLSSVYIQFNNLIAGSVSPMIGLYTDELQTNSTNSSVLEFYNSNISVSNSNNLNVWKNFYNVIYQCNALLEYTDGIPGATAETKAQLKAEALFLRAVSYYFLVNLYGDVPFILVTDVSYSSIAAKKPVADIYPQLIKDLITAKNIIPETYPGGEKVRANKWAVTALLAKIYTGTEKWAEAESACSEIISSGEYELNSSLNNVFVKNSKDAILQFWTQNGFAQVATLFIPGTGSVPTYQISSDLYNSFEAGDQRKIYWIKSVTITGQTYYYDFKYKNRTTTSGTATEYLMLLRYSDVLLNRAEARVHLNDFTGAKADLNLVRNRAGLMNTSATTQTSLLQAIEQERRVELFTEWGFRFYDLKRTGKINAVMLLRKTNWRMEAALLPIPSYEVLNNPFLLQNPGY